jgi:hypothetical protein
VTPPNITALLNGNGPDRFHRQIAAFMSILPEYFGVNAAVFAQDTNTNAKSTHDGTEEKDLGRQNVEAYSRELILGDKMLVPEDCEIYVLHSVGFDTGNMAGSTQAPKRRLSNHTRDQVSILFLLALAEQLGHKSMKYFRLPIATHNLCKSPRSHFNN